MVAVCCQGGNCFGILPNCFGTWLQGLLTRMFFLELGADTYGCQEWDGLQGRGGWLRCPQEVGKRGVHQDLLSPLGLGLSVR